MNLSQFSIRDLEQLSGIKAHTLRMWEKRYGLFCPSRSASNVRTFSDDDLRKLLNISILNQNGFKISRIIELDDRQLQEKVVSLNPSPSQSAAQIEALMLAMMKLDENHFTRILSQSILTLGMESTFLDIIFPFMHRIGVLWQTGSINPAHEHFMTNLIRQKLITGIAALNDVIRSGSRRIMIFLPEGELHELGMLFYTFLLKSWGHNILYLGSMTPLDSVVAAHSIWSADVLLTSLTSHKSTNEAPNEYVRDLATSFRDRKIIVAGPMVPILKRSDHPQITFMDDLKDLKKEFKL
jgi:DNA-binding transcriptional MerR regulator